MASGDEPRGKHGDIDLSRIEKLTDPLADLWRSANLDSEVELARCIRVVRRVVGEPKMGQDIRNCLLAQSVGDHGVPVGHRRRSLEDVTDVLPRLDAQARRSQIVKYGLD